MLAYTCWVKMRNIRDIKLNLNKLRHNEEGSLAVTWVFSLAATFSIIGAAVDLSMLHSSKYKSQSIADTTALAAAIYVKNHGGVPTNRDNGLLGEYKASELGYTYKNWVTGGSMGVKINVTYDDVNKEAIAEVTGKNTPVILQAFGHKSVGFKAKSTVKYEERSINAPVSVVMVLDTSKSMARDDRPDNASGVVSRIDGLEDSLTSFKAQIDSIVNNRPDNAPRAVRMGMVTYDDAINTNTKVNPFWGVLSQTHINRLSNNLVYGTNSSVGMAQAKSWLDNEHTYHLPENTAQNLKKYVIFMTDGANLDRAQQCEMMPIERHQHWRHVNNGNIRHTPPNNNAHKWEYVWAFPSNTPEAEREECLRPSIYDQPSIEDCNSLKAGGDTEIFTIGYALEPGNYYRTGRPNAGFVTVTAENTAKANNLLSKCASSPDHFLRAENADKLLEAFSNISTIIVETNLRITQNR